MLIEMSLLPSIAQQSQWPTSASTAGTEWLGSGPRQAGQAVLCRQQDGGVGPG